MASRKPLTNEDGEVRELTAADFKRARPAAEVLPRLIGKEAAAHLLKPRGRPKSPDAKVSISLRIPPQTLARWKASGPGWQTRMAAALTKASPRARRRAPTAGPR
ncbi:MAG: BrnA antitoxin family protein [Gammaproteobacteria bacterium]